MAYFANSLLSVDVLAASSEGLNFLRCRLNVFYHFAITHHPSPITLFLFFVIEGFRVAAVQFYL